MKTLSICAGFFLLVFALAYPLASKAQEMNGPQMVIEEKVFTHEEVEQGETIEHVFQVRNQGNETLVIKKVVPGWGCTVPRFDRNILPGGEGKIALRVKTSRYQGKITRSAKVYSNDPRNKLETVSIGVYVRVSIRVSPSAVNFSGEAGQAITKTVNVRAGLGKPLIIEPTAFDLEKKVKYRIEPVQEGKNFKIVFTNTPGSAETYRGFLKLKTNYTEKPEIVIPIRGKFRN